MDAAFAALAAAMEEAREPWWVIGSAALVLHGIDPGGIEDIDLLCSKRDGERLLARWGLAHADRPHARYRSCPYARWCGVSPPIEIMGGLERCVEGAWTPLRFATRVAVERAGVTLYTPALEEQAALLRWFGRDKDLGRLARIAAAKGQ
ncbi:hypothetical protein [Sphingomicrobium astaxanthinifaciens]|uniref:hypothetical protein n=1 Tax=Sphingomicrobium astaxanthinifaciens TaxID=1227949 RepID=UPI001FCBAB07|nr:hypothetical protein [Sphingomicrobium astaxanthinifaciens]MCJ7422013.1 hypothetical protein [Sphingomicrobium astaxanthinifaciens]